MSVCVETFSYNSIPHCPGHPVCSPGPGVLFLLIFATVGLTMKSTPGCAGMNQVSIEAQSNSGEGHLVSLELLAVKEQWKPQSLDSSGEGANPRALGSFGIQTSVVTNRGSCLGRKPLNLECCGGRNNYLISQSQGCC